MNLRNYGKGKSQQKTQNNPTADLLSQYGFDAQSAQKFSHLSEDELADQLIASVETAKRNGTYDAKKIAAIVAMLAPSLNEEKRRKLDNILKIIN